MSTEFLTFTVADVVGATMLLLATRAGWRFPWAWSIVAWLGAIGVGIGLIPLATLVPIAAMAFVIGVGLLTPIVGLIAVLTLLSSPVIAAVQAVGWWRRRRGLPAGTFQTSTHVLRGD
jgi:hypothetical protein